MTQDVQTTILSVVGRTTSRGNSVWDVQLGTGITAGTFNPQVATKAQQLQGQQVQVRYTQKDNGYFDLVDVAPPGQALTTPQRGGGGGGGGGRGMSPEDKQRMSRFAAAQTAATIVAGRVAGGEEVGAVIGDFRRLADEVYGWAWSGQWGGGAGVPGITTTAPGAPADATPQGIAAAVPGVQVGVPVQAPASAQAVDGPVVPWDQPQPVASG